MNYVQRAHDAAWKPVTDAVAQTVGFATPLHRAALEARLGKDPEGERFAQQMARLPAEQYQVLVARIEKLNGERVMAGCEN